MLDTLGIDFGWNLGYMYLDSMYYSTFSNFMNSEYIVNSSVNESVWCSKITEIITSYISNNTNNEIKDSLSICAEYFLEQVNLIETELLATNWLTGESKALKLLSLFKHTSYFWFQKIYIDQNSIKLSKTNSYLQFTKNKEEFVDKMKRFSWYSWVVAADVAGNFAGSAYAAFAWEARNQAGFWDSYFRNIWDTMYKK